MANVVVADDDAVARSAITGLCEDAGLNVVAETDSGLDAVELVRRFGVDVVVLDLALAGSSGEQTLEALRDLEESPVVLVFTAYAEDEGLLLRLGAREIIEKPDFAALAAALASVASSVEDAAPSGERDRRRMVRSVDPLPDLWRSPSGVSASSDMSRVLGCVVEGDTLLLISVGGLDSLEAKVGPLLSADCHLAAARLLRVTLRTQDAIVEVGEADGFLAVLRGGDGRAAEAAWIRLMAAWRSAEASGDLLGCTTRLQNGGGRDALSSVVRARASAGPGGPALIRVSGHR